MGKLTNEDVRSIGYFWLEQRDLQNWCGWEAALPVLREEWPGLLQALDDYNRAMRTANALAALVDEIVKDRVQDTDELEAEEGDIHG